MSQEKQLSAPASGGASKKKRSGANTARLRSTDNVEEDTLFVPLSGRTLSTDVATQTSLSSILLLKEQESCRACADAGVHDIFERWPAVEDSELTALAQRGDVTAFMVMSSAKQATAPDTQALVHHVSVTCAKRQFSIRSRAMGHETMSFSRLKAVRLGHSSTAFGEYFSERLRAEVRLKELRAAGKATLLAEHQATFAQRFLPDEESEVLSPSMFRTLSGAHRSVYQSLTLILWPEKVSSGYVDRHGDELNLVFASAVGYDAFLTTLRTNYPFSSVPQRSLSVGYSVPLPLGSQLPVHEPVEAVLELLSADEVQLCLEFHVPFHLYIQIKKRVLHPQNPSLITKRDIFSSLIVGGPAARSFCVGEKGGFDTIDRFRLDSVLEFFRRQEWITFHTVYDSLT